MKRFTYVVAVVLLAGVCATAQVAWNEQAFNNKASSGFSQVFRNVNQSSHWLTYCSGFGVTGGTIEIDASADQSHWVTISNIGVLSANQCGVIQGGGYYPYVTAQIKNFAGGAPGVTATYSASVGPVSLPANTGYSTSTQPVTMIPTNTSTVSSLKSAGYQFSLVSAALYGATVYNPNSGTVYVAFGSSSTPFSGGGTSVFMIPVAAGQTATFSITQGIGFTSALWVGCSTSPTSAVDPTTACVVSAAYKQSSGTVPN